METGQIIWFNSNKWYGFIESENYDEDIFFHYEDAIHDEKFRKEVIRKDLEEIKGITLLFDVEDTKAGLEARNILLADEV